MEMKIVKYFMQIRDWIKFVFKYVSIVCQYQNSIFFKTENDIGKYFMKVTDWNSYRWQYLLIINILSST